MSIFNNHRLTQHELQLDIEGLRRGHYSDQYFANIVRILSGLQEYNYTFQGRSNHTLPADVTAIKTGSLVVEAQIFNRRAPRALIVGVDVALAMLRHVTGYYDGDDFIETWQQLEVDAIEDGMFTEYEGDTEDVLPVIRIRGIYRDFALLETPMLGVLSRATRIATNVYRVMEVSNGKPVLFFPARFDLPDVQALDGYAYQIAVRRYNLDYGQNTLPSVSTDAQGSWWGGRGGGTMPHSLIAAFLGDTAEAMMQFAQYIPIYVPRIVLADFNNDVIGDSLATLGAFWSRYVEALASGSEDDQQRWTLFGVRIDTSPNIRDVSLPVDAPGGISPLFVRVVRKALDSAWERWNVPAHLQESAQTYCRNVKIVVTGGFNRERIQQYESEGVPVDVYGVGSSLLRNESSTNTDHTMDVVKVKLGEHWVDAAKIGRKANDNPDLKPVDLSQF